MTKEQTQAASSSQGPKVDALPDPVREEHLHYLDALRKSGATNMFGARPYLMAAFPELTAREAVTVLAYWMDSFVQRHPAGAL